MLLPKEMRRALFALWLVSSAVCLFAIGALLNPAVLHFGSLYSLIVGALWTVLVAPLSFRFWFRVQRAREQQEVEQALKSWRDGAPGAGTLVAHALELVLAEEDEASLRRLLEVLEGGAPQQLEPALQPFRQAAQSWLRDDGGRSSRDEHLEQLKAAYRGLAPVLAHG